MALPKGYKFKAVSAAKLIQANQAGTKGRETNSALAVKRRKEYNESPNLCLDCGTPILIPEGAQRGESYWIKKKKFCNHSCGAKYHNRVLGYPHRKPKVRACVECGTEYISPYKRSTRCDVCKKRPKLSVLGRRKKFECRIQDVRSHARKVLFRARERKCEICGYSVRVDCCHVKAVKEFSKNALLSEINELSNLKALCPNHHVELDLGLLKISVGV
jgi:hypothetical protein